MIVENFLDLDTAYLLGLIVIRGRLIETGGDHRIVIDFPSKNLLATGIKLKFDQKKHLRLGANQVRDRLGELLGTEIRVNESGRKVQFIARFLGSNMIWRNLRHHFGDQRAYTEFSVPKAIIDSPEEVKIEFMRGIADAGGFIRHSNNYMGHKRRVYIEVNNRNWSLPIQLCWILQRGLGVPVQLIQWGHPNTRTPGVQTGRSWAKEHQLKIFAEHFRKVGFHIEYKQQILEEFVADDEKLGGALPSFCNPNPKLRRVLNKKPKHPGERSDYIPRQIRGKHFDTYWQICLALGCQQCVEAPQREMFDIERARESEA